MRIPVIPRHGYRGKLRNQWRPALAEDDGIHGMTRLFNEFVERSVDVAADQNGRTILPKVR